MFLLSSVIAITWAQRYRPSIQASRWTPERIAVIRSEVLEDEILAIHTYAILPRNLKCANKTNDDNYVVYQFRVSHLLKH